MKQISINKDIVIDVDNFGWQTSPQGNKFRLTGLRKNSQLPVIYVNEKGEIVNKYAKDKIEKYHWIYTFLYEDGKQFEIEIGFDDKFLKLTK